MRACLNRSRASISRSVAVLVLLPASARALVVAADLVAALGRELVRQVELLRVEGVERADVAAGLADDKPGDAAVGEHRAVEGADHRRLVVGRTGTEADDQVALLVEAALARRLIQRERAVVQLLVVDAMAERVVAPQLTLALSFVFPQVLDLAEHLVQ